MIFFSQPDQNILERVFYQGILPGSPGLNQNFQNGDPWDVFCQVIPQSAKLWESVIYQVLLTLNSCFLELVCTVMGACYFFKLSLCFIIKWKFLNCFLINHHVVNLKNKSFCTYWPEFFSIKCQLRKCMVAPCKNARGQAQIIFPLFMSHVLINKSCNTR